MKQEYKKYPRYKAGQLLTNDDLNSSFDYLDEQVRMSRVMMSNPGIINGCDYDVTSRGEVTILPGDLITDDGFLINLNGNFDNNNLKINLPEILKKVKEDDKFVLFVKAKRRVGAESSGDINTGNKLSAEEEITFDIGIDKEYKFKEVSLDKLFKTSSPLQFVDRKLIQNLELKKLRTTMLDIAKSEKNNIVSFIDGLIELNNFYTNIIFTNDDIKAISSAKEKMKNLIADRRTEIPQYYLFFMYDVRVEIYNAFKLIKRFISKYPTISSYKFPENCYGLGLIEYVNGIYRKSVYNASYRSVGDYNCGPKKELVHNIRMSVLKITDMIRYFIADKESGKDVKFERLIKDNSGFELNKTIPAYYNKETNIKYDDIIIKFRNDPIKDIYILQGDYWMKDVNEVYDKLSSCIQRNNLPIILKKEQLYKKKNSDTYNRYIDQIINPGEDARSVLNCAIPNLEDLIYDHYKFDFRGEEVNQPIDKFTHEDLKDMENLKLAKIKKNSQYDKYGDYVLLKQLEMYIQPDDYNPPFDGLKKEIMQRIHRYGVIFDYKEYLGIKCRHGDNVESDLKLTRMIVYLSKMVSNFPNDVKLSDTVECGKTFVLLHYNGHVVATASCSNYESLLKIS